MVKSQWSFMADCLRCLRPYLEDVARKTLQIVNPWSSDSSASQKGELFKETEIVPLSSQLATSKS